MDYYLVIGSPEIYPDNAYSTKSKTLYSKSIISGNGDLNFDSKCDVTDLTDLSLAIIGDKKLNADQQKAADVDGDGAVTLADLARLQQYLSKKITAF
jgi:hypothetical protein